MSFSSQVPIQVGSHKIACQCGNTINVRVSRPKKDDRGPYYPYRTGACRKCGTIYSGARRTRVW